MIRTDSRSSRAMHDQTALAAAEAAFVASGKTGEPFAIGCCCSAKLSRRSAPANRSSVVLRCSSRQERAGGCVLLRAAS